jgi:hypothetical protein
MKWLLLLVAAVVWSFLAWMFIFVFAGTHVCGILNTGANGSLTQEEMDQQMARCNRPDYGAIGVFGVGYVFLAGVAIGRIRWERGTPGG